MQAIVQLVLALCIFSKSLRAVELDLASSTQHCFLEILTFCMLANSTPANMSTHLDLCIAHCL